METEIIEVLALMSSHDLLLEWCRDLLTQQTCKNKNVVSISVACIEAA